jgi:hypothetical protein
LQAFEVDEDAPEFRVLHPNKQKSNKKLVSEHFDLVSESDDEKERGTASGDDSDASSSSSDDGTRVSAKRNKKPATGNGDIVGKKRKAPEPRFVSLQILSVMFVILSA